MSEVESVKRRIYSVDLLRGVVMMLMLLDHTRDFVHEAALTADPTNLETTTAPLFFTRWITHYCAPTFVFLSGVSIYLQKLNGKTTAELARFLFTRGLWLIVVEFTLVRTSFVFNLDYSFFGVAQVIWVIGLSMIVMAALIYLPRGVIAGFGIILIGLHNLLDAIQVPPNVAFAGDPAPDAGQVLWMLLHQPGVVPLFGGASSAFVAYPLIPWTGVMALGYVVGSVYAWDDGRRRRWLFALGGAATAGFVLIRFLNIYGDPVPWSVRSTPAFTLLSFLNTTKYPPSLLFLLMTLGPSLLLLALTDRIDGRAIWQRIAIVYGRVPMLYYLLQFPVAHLLGIILSVAAGKEIGYFFMNFPQNAAGAPPGYGFSLGVTYAAWLAGLVLLYPVCLWYGRYKQKNKHWLLSYL